MKTILTLVFLFAFGLSITARADESKPLPDPFCSPNDFFTYLKARNHDRVLYVVTKCPNINLADKGPRGETFVSELIQTDWDDIFALVINHPEVNFQGLTDNLTKLGKYNWVIELAKKDSITLTIDDATALAETWPTSKSLLQTLIDLNKVDFKKFTQKMVDVAFRTTKFDLIEYLRTFGSVDDSAVWSYTCRIATLSTTEAESAKFNEYFKFLIKSDRVDVNTSCDGSHPIASALGNKKNPLKVEIIELLLAHKGLNLSTKTHSYNLVTTLMASNEPLAKKWLELVLSHPTFNVNDSSSKGLNFWNVLAGALQTGYDTPEFVAFFKDLSEDSINSTHVLTAIIKNFRGDLIPNPIDKDPIMAKIFSNKNLNLQATLEGNLSPVGLALTNSNPAKLIKYLQEKGASDDLGKPADNYAAAILRTIVEDPALFDKFFTRPELNINTPVINTTTTNIFSYLFFKADWKKVRSLIDDKRFDKKQLNDVTQECILIYLMKDKKNHQLLKDIANMMNPEKLNASGCRCSTGTDSFRGNYLQLVATLGDIDLLNFFYKEKKLVMNSGQGLSAFRLAVESMNWAVVNYFLDDGYLSEINTFTLVDGSSTNNRLLDSLLYKKQTELIKKVIAQKGFKPNGFLEDVIRYNLKEVFDSLTKHPEFNSGDGIAEAARHAKKTQDFYYLENIITKFKIVTDEDKTFAVEGLAAIAESKLPIKYFAQITALPRFDVNFVTPKGYDNKTYTLYVELLSDVTGSEYIDHVTKMKNFNPAIVTTDTAIDALLYNPNLNHIALTKKYFDQYFSYPKVPAVIPTSFHPQAYMPGIAALFLSNPKFKISKEKLAEFFKYREDFSAYSVNSVETEKLFLNGFFTQPAAKPLKDWSAILWSVETDAHLIELIKKYGNDLDLNVVEGSRSLLGEAIYDNNIELFKLLIANKKVSVAGSVYNIMYSKNEEMVKTYFSTRGSEISNAEMLKSIADYLEYHIRSKKTPLDQVDYKRLDLMIPLTKNFDTFAKLASDSYRSPSILVTVFEWSKEIPTLEKIFNRALKEDTTINESKDLFLAALKKLRYDVTDVLIARPNPTFSKYQAVAYAFSIKSLEMVNYLVTKNNFPADLDAFRAAMSTEWYEGMDFLISMRIRLYSEFMTYAVKSKKTTLVKYLMSKGLSLNKSGALTIAIVDQNDELLEIFLNDAKTDPNDQGMDEEMKRFTYPIIEAARNGRIDYVKALLQFPAIKKDIKDQLGYRAIDWAATNGHLEIVKLLKL